MDFNLWEIFKCNQSIIRRVTGLSKRDLIKFNILISWIKLGSCGISFVINLQYSQLVSKH
jgi:hypothetical protein